MLLFHQFNDLVVNFSLSFSRTCQRGVTAKILVGDCFKGNHVEVLIHTVAGDHGTGKAGCLFDIIGSPCCDGAEDNFFSGTTTCKCSNLILNFFFAHQIVIAFIHLHGVTKGTGCSRNNRDLLDRRRIVLFCSHKRMSDFVVGNNKLLFVGENRILLLVTGNNGFNTFFQIGLRCKASIVTDCAKRCFVDNIRQFGTGSTGSHTGNLIKIDIVRKTNLLGMDFQNFFTALQIRQFNRHTSVKTSRTGQGRIQGFGSVGSCKNNNTCVAFKTIHLSQQLIQCLFTFIIAANLAVTLLADGIDFINKNDTWSFLLRLFEQVTDLGSTHTYEHFDKF